MLQLQFCDTAYLKPIEFLIPPSIISPGRTGPILGGLPVIIKSFSSNVMYCDINAINCGIVKIKSFVFPSCLISQFTESHRSTLCGSAMFFLGMKLLTGQAVSKPLPRVQDPPLLRASCYKNVDISLLTQMFQSKKSIQHLLFFRARLTIIGQL